MYLFFDTETTGFGYKARMTQLAFQLYDVNGRLINEYESLVKPDGWEVPKTDFFISNNMSTERCEKHGKPLFNVLRALQDSLKLCSYKIAHNLKFDNGVVSREISRTDITPQLFQFKKGFCTMQECRYFPGIELNHAKKGKAPSLKDLHNYVFGKDFDNAHDALADVKAMSSSFFELKKKGLIKI